MKAVLTFVLVVIGGLCFAQEHPTKDQSPTSGQPILVVDGIKYLRADSTNAFQNLNPEKIKSVKVLKGQEAIDLYGEDGKFGVVVVTTKSAIPKNQPLYLLDGKRVDDLSSIDPTTIQSIEVIKDSVRLQPYGSDGELGVIKIISKKRVH